MLPSRCICNTLSLYPHCVGPLIWDRAVHYSIWHALKVGFTQEIMYTLWYTNAHQLHSWKMLCNIIWHAASIELPVHEICLKEESDGWSKPHNARGGQRKSLCFGSVLHSSFTIWVQQNDVWYSCTYWQTVRLISLMKSRFLRCNC